MSLLGDLIKSIFELPKTLLGGTPQLQYTSTPLPTEKEEEKEDPEETKRREKKKLRKRQGLPTILTTPLGLTGAAPTRKPTLLGG